MRLAPLIFALLCKTSVGGVVLGNHGEVQFSRQREIAAQTDLSTQIRNINTALGSPDRVIANQAFRAAQQLVFSGQANIGQFDSRISNLVTAPTLTLVHLSRNGTAQEREIAGTAAQENLEAWRRGINQRGLDPLAFQQAVAGFGGLSDVQQRQVAAQFGKMMGQRFDLGLLQDGPDREMSNQMRQMWKYAESLADGTRKPVTAFDKALLAEFKKSEANRQAFWDAMGTALRTGNANGLSNWTENFPNFLQNLQATERNIASGQTTLSPKQQAFFNSSRQQITALFGTATLSEIRLEQNFIAQANQSMASRRQGGQTQGSGQSQSSDLDVVGTGQAP